MNNKNPFVRKIIYIACIGGLLIPLSLVSRPETRDGDGSIVDGGGQLSILREDYDLSQAKISEIDPASETMKLASLGLRGVAVNMLWMQAMEHKKLEQYDKLASTLQALTKIQPSFVKVWEYQAHNLAYNVSMEFDDYEYRYQWVKKGISFLKRGIPYNKRDHRVTDNMGFFTGNKMGKSDEHLAFRRMFRKDDEFHQDMSDFIDPDSYDEREYGHDSWKLAYQWYDYSLKMVEEQSCFQRTGDMLFYMNRPSQLRNQALGLQEEYRSEEVVQNIWANADEEWKEYGNQKIANTTGVTITLEGMAELESQMETWRSKLDALVEPGTRMEMMEDLMAAAQLTDEQKAVMKLPLDERDDEQTQMVRNINEKLWTLDRGMDAKIAFSATEDNRAEANKIVLEIAKIQSQMRAIDKDSGTVNYRYWRARNKAESQDVTSAAHQAYYDAKQMWRQSIYDDEYDVDYKTKKKTITKQGAMSLYLDAFAKWAEILEEYPELKDGHLANEVLKGIKAYQNMLITTNREWPVDFPLQKFLDDRFEVGERDGLPTTDILREIYSGRSDMVVPETVKTAFKDYNASHILVEEEARAIELIKELDAGANFEDLAKENSTGPSKNKGGSLGWFNAEDMVPEFSIALGQMKVGEHSATPVKTKFGYHVIKLNNLGKEEEARNAAANADDDSPTDENKSADEDKSEKAKGETDADKAGSADTKSDEEKSELGDNAKSEDPKSGDADKAKADSNSDEAASEKEKSDGDAKDESDKSSKEEAPITEGKSETQEKSSRRATDK
ncbi:MAG: peptidylprolyl isomerase [Mariniblastus sp.]